MECYYYPSFQVSRENINQSTCLSTKIPGFLRRSHQHFRFIYEFIWTWDPSLEIYSEYYGKNVMAHIVTKMSIRHLMLKRLLTFTIIVGSASGDGREMTTSLLSLSQVYLHHWLIKYVALCFSSPDILFGFVPKETCFKEIRCVG